MACLGMCQLWYGSVRGFESTDSSMPQLPQDSIGNSMILMSSELVSQYRE